MTLLAIPTGMITPPPTAVACLCIWERPPRTATVRTRRMVAVETTCATHKTIANQAKARGATSYQVR
jgi:hypothetical protein